MNPKPLIGSKIIRLQSVESTNNYVIGSMKEKNYAEGTLIITNEQYAGKGLGQNSWESQPGKNLTFSFVIYPRFLPPARQFMLNMFTSLAVYDFISRRVNNERTNIKWPNDVYIDDGKVCGILINNSIKGNTFEHVVIGIGVNINQEIFKSDAPNPVSLKQITGKEYNPEECLSKLIDRLNNRYLQLVNNQFDALNTDYHHVLYRKDEFHYFRENKITFKGKIKGVNEFGKLMMHAQDGRYREFDFKEIEFLNIQYPSY